MSMSTPIPKGANIWYFNALGQSNTDHTKVQGKIVWKCVAINQHSATEKFRKIVETLFTNVNPQQL